MMIATLRIRTKPLPRLVFAAALAATLLLPRCGQTPEPPPPAEPPPPPAVEPAPEWLELVGSVPLKGDPLDNRIVLFFDEKIMLPANEAGEVPTPFTITPSVRGEYRVDSNYVSFRVTGDAPAPGMVYTINLHPDIQSPTGKRLPPRLREFRYATFQFGPGNVWEIEKSPEQTVLAVQFPVPVGEDELRRHTSVIGHDGNPLDFMLVPGTGPTVYNLVFTGRPLWPGRITFAEGLTDATGWFELAGERVFGYPTQPFFHVISARWGKVSEDEKEVLIDFSEPVTANTLAQHLTVSDEATGAAIPFTVEPVEPIQPPTEEPFEDLDEETTQDPPAAERDPFAPAFQYRVLLEIDGKVEGSVKVALPKGMPGLGEMTLIDAFTTALHGEPRPLTVASVTWGATDGRRHELHLRFSDAVKRSDLTNKISLTGEPGALPLRYQAQTEERTDTHTLLLEPIEPAYVNVLIELAEGMPGANNTVLMETYTERLERPAPPLRIEDTWWGTSRKDGLTLTMGLSVTVNTEDLQKRIEITPPVPNLQVTPWHGNYYRITGDWRSKTPYTLRIPEGVLYAGGSRNPREVTRQLMSEEVPPFIGFGHEGKYYFPMRTGSPIVVTARNVEKATLVLHRMFPSNLVVALEDMGMNTDRDDGDYYYGYGDRGGRFISRWSTEVARTEVVLDPRRDIQTETPVDLAGLLPPERRGVFCLEIRSDQGSNTRVALFTNIGVLAHWQSDEVVVFAHNLFSLAPLPDAKVTVYSSKNQMMGVATTDEKGLAHLTGLDKTLGEPKAVVVEHGDDFTFLELARRQEDAPDITPGMPGYDRDGYDAFLYADRDLYRPGETIHARWMVRTNYGDAVADVPLLVTVVRPNGQNLLTQTTQLSAMGGGGMDIATDRTYPTGKYTIRITVPGDRRVIGSYTFSLEEFVPNRLDTTVDVPEKIWMTGQAYDIKVNAMHLFGAPAADRRSMAKAAFERAGWATQNWKGFRFENDADYKPDTVSVGETQTDAEGNAAFKFSYSAPGDVTFPLRATVLGGVFELGGRVVYDTTEAMFFPSDLCIGARVANAEGGSGIEVFAAAVRPDESPADLDKVTVTLEKQVWNYYVRRFTSHYESNWTKSFDPIDTKEIALENGRGSTVFPRLDYGYYRVRVYSDKTMQYSTVSFYSYRGRCEVVSAPRPSLIKLSLDKAVYLPGDEAVLRVESPFDGQGVLVVQGDDYHHMTPVEIRDNVGEARIAVTEAFFPNVWVGVTVIHAVQTDRTQVHPFSSFATIPLRVENPERNLKIAFPDLPEEIRPAEAAQFAVEVLGSDGQPRVAEVTLAAVDEGIHAITDYKNPAPYDYFARPRQPDHRRAHYYDKVAYDFDKPATGGDALRRLAKRTAGADDNWIKPVALWSGVVRTDESGRATVTMEVPEFTGQLRLVAVACTEGATGADGAKVYVRRPYMLRTSMPRFMLPDDRARCTAVVFNTTGEPCTARISWLGTGALQGEGSAEVEAPAGGEGAAEAAFTAASASGQGSIVWEAVILDAQGRELERLKETAPLPVRTPAAYQSTHQFVVVGPGETREFRNDRVLDDERTELEMVVGANPQLRLYKALKYVVGYPYGCVEQTTSRLMPMYLLRKSGDLVKENLKDAATLDSFIEAGIDRLFAMQTVSGGLGYWPGSRQDYPYGSVYALHFLTLVKNGREYPLPEDQYEALRNYVRGIASDWSAGTDAHSLYARVYATYVLALGGDLAAIEQIGRFDSITVPRPARYLLAAALAQTTQDRDRVMLYLRSAPTTPYTVVQLAGTLNSEIRNTAVELLALRQIGAEATLLHEKAEALIAYLEDRRHGNTQETAFIVSALADYLGDVAAKAVNAAASVTGPDGEKAITGMEVYRGRHEGPGGVFTVANTGEAPMFVNFTVGGIPEKPDTEPVSKGVSIERRILTARGEPRKEADFRQSDTYVVGLTIHCERKAENLIVVDMLPAGLEIENPRLSAETVPPGRLNEAATTSFLDVRDDRLVLAFNELSSGKHYFYYVVRAVTPGTYQHPPAVAELMYDASVRGATDAGTAQVLPVE